MKNVLIHSHINDSYFTHNCMVLKHGFSTKMCVIVAAMEVLDMER